VHKFSHPYMPLRQLFVNCAYYWLFTLLVGYPLVHPAYSAPGAAQVAAGCALWAASQLVNFAVHLQLAGMRGAEGDDSRKPPTGALFALVTSPNYTAEVLGWVGWCLVSNVAMGYLFTLAGFLQMAQWALKKYNGYRRSDEGKAYARGRKAIIPFLL
jgi:very-long-chain enoyl-CoA reductase